MKSYTFTSLTFLFFSIYSFTVNAQRTFDSVVNYPVGVNPKSVAVGDFNNDGIPDLVVANSSANNNISVLIGTGLGTFGTAISYNVGSWPRGVAVGYFNGDGFKDIVVANNGSSNISVLTGTGTGSFGNPVNFTVGSSPFSIAIGDFNGDSKQDLVVSRSANISVLTGTGNGTFGTSVNYSISMFGTTNVAIADINSDSKQDLIVAADDLSFFYPLTGTGTGSFGYAPSYGTSLFSRSVATGDINGDGKQDFVLARQNYDDVAVVTSNGLGGFGAIRHFAVVSVPSSVILSDINGDGKLDIAVTNSFNNSVSVLTGSGTGSFGAAVNYQVSSFPEHLVATDFNGDGKQDLAVVNSGSNNISILLAKDLQQINGFTVPSAINYGNTLNFNSTATSGLQINYSSSNSSILNVSNTNATATGVGVVTITAFQSGNGGWFGATLISVITITKANLTVSANNASIVYGEPIPTFTGTLLGVVNQDQISVLYGTTANTSSNAGVYSITSTIIGANIGNYNIVNQTGLLTISKATQSISGFNLPNNVVLGSGIWGLNNSSSSSLPVSYNTFGNVIEKNNTLYFYGVGPASVTAFQNGNDNHFGASSVVHNFTVLSAVITVVSPPVTVTSIVTITSPPIIVTSIITVTSTPITVTSIVNNTVTSLVTITSCISTVSGLLEKLELARVDIIPNPTSGLCKIIAINITVTSVDVFNIQSSFLGNRSVMSDVLDLSDLPDGLYLLRLKNNGTTIGNAKVILQQ